MSEKFIHVPLPVLHYGKSIPERVNAMLHYTLVEMAGKFAADPEDRHQFAYERVAEQNLPAGFDDGIDRHVFYVAAQCALGTVRGNLAKSFHDHKELSEMFADWERRYGPAPRVNIARDILFSVINGKMSYNELRVLCAVYAKLGGGHRVLKITSDEINRYSLGYSRRDVMDCELPRRKDTLGPLPRKTVNAIARRLCERGFFCRYTPKGRRVKCYYGLMAVERFAELVKPMLAQEGARGSRETQIQELLSV